MNLTSTANYQIFPTYYIYKAGIFQYAIYQVSPSTITEPMYSGSQLVPPHFIEVAPEVFEYGKSNIGRRNSQ